MFVYNLLTCLNKHTGLNETHYIHMLTWYEISK